MCMPASAPTRDHALSTPASEYHHAPAAYGRASGAVGRPGEDERPHGDEPAAGHHRNETGLSGRAAAVPVHERQVVFVDEGGADGGADDAHGDGDEHEARDAR